LRDILNLPLAGRWTRSWTGKPREAVTAGNELCGVNPAQAKLSVHAVQY